MALTEVNWLELDTELVSGVVDPVQLVECEHDLMHCHTELAKSNTTP